MDPVPMAWELLPWSFVVDWFIPIGNYLAAKGLQTAITGSFVTTHVFKLESFGQKAKMTSSWVAFANHNGSKCSVKWTNISRTVSTTLSVPLPEFKSLEKVASWGHALNAVALLLTTKR
jgi:hypothetical protein